MKILVTGGAGYLGSEVARLAADRGWDVFATEFGHRPPFGDPVRIDLREGEDTYRCVLGIRPQVIVHTAYRREEELVQQSIVDTTRHVATAAARAGSRLLHISSDLVFDGTKPGRYIETDPPHPVSRYGEAKLAAERLVAGLCPDSLIIRTSLLYGKPGPQEALVLRADVTFYLDEIRTPVHVSDFATALIELADTSLKGILHLGGPDAVSRYEFARLLAAAQGRNPDDIRGGPSPSAGRARNVALDSSRAYALLHTRIRGLTNAKATMDYRDYTD